MPSNELTEGFTSSGAIEEYEWQELEASGGSVGHVCLLIKESMVCICIEY